MVVDTRILPYNVRFSIQKWVKDNFDTPNSIYGVNYSDVLFDHDQRDEDATVLSLWVAIHFLQNMAGYRGATMVQFDCYSRLNEGQTNEDRYGIILARMVKVLMDIFTVQSIPMIDFFTDPTGATPIDDNCIIVQNSVGMHRSPEEVLAPLWEGDMLREIVTYRFRTARDFGPLHVFESGV